MTLTKLLPLVDGRSCRRNFPSPSVLSSLDRSCYAPFCPRFPPILFIKSRYRSLLAPHRCVRLLLDFFLPSFYFFARMRKRGWNFVIITRVSFIKISFARIEKVAGTNVNMHMCVCVRAHKGDGRHAVIPGTLMIRHPRRKWTTGSNYFGS